MTPENAHSDGRIVSTGTGRSYSCFRCGQTVLEGCTHSCPTALPTHGTIVGMNTKSPRGAVIEIDQQPNGCWSVALHIRIPGLPEQHFSNAAFHNAREAMDWALVTLEAVTLDAR